MPRYVILLAVLLAGCTVTKPCPGPEVVTVRETVRVPVPAEFTAGCNVECDIVTNGDLLECYAKQRQALIECGNRMREIRGLK